MKLIDKIFRTKKEVEQELKKVLSDQPIKENKEILSKEIETSIKKYVDKTQVNEKETLDAFENARRK